MTTSKYEINDTALIRNVPAEKGFFQNDLVITKEEFVACYNKWIASTTDIQNAIKKLEDKSNV